MILADLKTLLQAQKMMNLLELARRLQAEPDAVRSMLAVWIRKGRVLRCAQLPGCGSKCIKCNPLVTETYQWVE